MRSMLAVCLCAATAAAVAMTCAPGAPGAGTAVARDGAAVDLEVSEASAGGATRTDRFSATVVQNEQPASLRASAGAAQYEVSLAWRDGQGRDPLLLIDFKQHRAGEPPTELHVPAYLTPGKRKVVGSLIRADGSLFSLAVTLR